MLAPFAILAALFAAIAAVFAGIRRILRGTRTVGGAVIHTPTDDTRMARNGAVRSVQSADIIVSIDLFEDLWHTENLERLARTYWSYLSSCTLGLIRVRYTERERFVTLLGVIKLLTFDAPEYLIEPDHGVVRWRIVKGVLVARKGREEGDGYLEIEVRRLPYTRPGKARINVEVTVANFYPQVAHALSRMVYINTQSRIHVIVTHGFLRRLVRRELDESVIGRFADPSDPAPGSEAREHQEAAR
jgi:hypothetical protein